MKRFPAFLFLFFVLTGLAEAGTTSINPTDETGINEALKQGGTVYLNHGVYEIGGPIYIGSDTVLTGSKDAIIRVSPSTSQFFVKATGIINPSEYPLKNVEIYGFQIDGNLDQLPRSYANYGTGDHNAERLIYLQGKRNTFMENISVHDMTLYDSYSDGLQIAYCNNAQVYNNFVSNCQHSGIFLISVVGANVFKNDVAGITSDCIRLDNCVNTKVFDNVLYSYTGDNLQGQGTNGENGLQIADEGYSHGGGGNKPLHTENIEVFNNTFANTGWHGIWLDSTGKGVANVYIHDNKFLKGAEFKTGGFSVEGISYNNPPTKEQSEKVFESIFDFLEMEFSDTANTTNTEVYPSITWEEKGKSRAWVDIVGWDNLIERDGAFYIPEGQQPIIRYEAENTASRPVKTRTDVTLSEDNGTLTADLEVKAYYEVAKRTTKRVNGISVPSIELVRKSKTSHYYDSEPIPERYRPAINSTAYVTIINNSMSAQTRIYIPESPDVMKVLFEYNNSQTWHYLHTCTLNQTEKGVKFAQISDLDYWEGENVTRLDNILVLSGAVDPDQVKITQYDIYGKEIPITDYEIEVKTQDEKNLVHPVTFLFSGIVGFFLIATYKVFEVFL
jgi:hypothetical protein